ncbi:MAG TPA: class I SAM-dependent methyltransferase, partial [Polyangiaceae bacterium]|nr:class I SAM-dependent methyltransferase [Polyangiaceae bacterium]
VVPETGRTHQVRVQLATAGLPIVGDTVYGGPPHLRVMLHAERLGLRHPVTGEPLSFRASTPPMFALALSGAKLERPSSPDDLDACLREAAGRRYGIIARGGTDAVRWIHADGDGLPGVTVDLYGEHAVLSIYEELAKEEVTHIAEALVRVGARGVYVKYRPKNASRIVDSRTDEVAPKDPIAGEPAPDAFDIHENGIPFEVRLGDGLSTGIFLDQRDTRRRVRELAGGRSVLNLFAYTGAFSVAAASGGAASTLTVDVSRGALAWAEKNLERVGARAPEHTTAEADTFDFLLRAAKRGQKWDLVILDPPSFSTTKRSTWSAESAYDELAAHALAVVSAGGLLLACTNHRKIPMGKLRKMLHAAGKTAGREIVQMKSLPPPVDYPPTPGFEPHLKCVLLHVR